MINPNKGRFNQVLNRYELPYIIYCSHCKKHICDADFEMEPKLCLRCSGLYDRILARSGVKNKSKNTTN